jgi:hypothetical protein
MMLATSESVSTRDFSMSCHSQYLYYVNGGVTYLPMGLWERVGSHGRVEEDEP